MVRRLILASCLLAMSSAGAATDTTTYSYDALGRLVSSTTSRPQGQVVTTVTFDAAGNRTKLTTSGAVDMGSDPGAGASAPSQRRLVVVPLNGFTIIPIG